MDMDWTGQVPDYGLFSLDPDRARLSFLKKKNDLVGLGLLACRGPDSAKLASQP